jgi:cytochrome P450
MDTELNGCPIQVGNMALLSFPSANRDTSVFPDAERVVLDRKPNRHIAFGFGIHNCLGANLARMESTVALQQWLAKIPTSDLHPARRSSGLRDRYAGRGICLWFLILWFDS